MIKGTVLNSLIIKDTIRSVLTDTLVIIVDHSTLEGPGVSRLWS